MFTRPAGPAARDLGRGHLVPGRVFGSSAGRGATRPSKLIVLVYLGAAALTAGVLALGIGLLTA